MTVCETSFLGLRKGILFISPEVFGLSLFRRLIILGGGCPYFPLAQFVKKVQSYPCIIIRYIMKIKLHKRTDRHIFVYFIFCTRKVMHAIQLITLIIVAATVKQQKIKYVSMPGKNSFSKMRSHS